MPGKQIDVEHDMEAVVHLTEYRGGWSIVVSTNGEAACSHSEHREADAALAAAKRVAGPLRAGLLIVWLDGEWTLVRPEEVAAYIYPPRRHQR